MPASLSDADRELLHGKNFAHFATLLASGAPHVAPVWIDERDGKVLVNTAEGRTKIKNVRKDPRVALSLTDSSNPYRMLSVQGRVVRETTDGAEEHIDSLSNRYGGRDYPDHGDRVILEIEPEHLFRMGY